MNTERTQPYSFEEAFADWNDGYFQLADYPLEQHDPDCWTPQHGIIGGHEVYYCCGCGDVWRVEEIEK